MIRPEVLAFADEIREAIADANASLSLGETPAEPGYEPTVIFCVRGIPLFYFRRDEFIEAIYVAGCDAMEELERKGLPLTAGHDLRGGSLSDARLSRLPRLPMRAARAWGVTLRGLPTGRMAPLERQP